MRGDSARPAGPRSVTLDVPLRGPRGPRLARGRWVVSPRMRSPRALTLLGLSWKGAAPGTLEMRVRRRGRWSRWVELPAIGGHAPDSARQAQGHRWRLRGRRAHVPGASPPRPRARCARTAWPGPSPPRASPPARRPRRRPRAARPASSRARSGAPRPRARHRPTAVWTSRSCTTRCPRTTTRRRSRPRWCGRSSTTTATPSAGTTWATTSWSTASGRSTRAVRAGSTRP